MGLVIRVNSRSGRGGVAYPLRTHHGLDLPPRMRPDLPRVVQEATDDSGRELPPEELHDLDLLTETHLAEGPPKAAEFEDTGTVSGLLDARRAHPRPATVLVTHHLVGKCLDLPLALERHGGRWTVRIERRS
ncbi:hypothetical protein [Streptomyces sp. NBC_00103]|uniref:hypothetical protein n=1 Tax=Streptomyces sp. NBC_00103 TaxID=2975653 RepID=UPI0022528324|nr:hypothetical protein [Streptomyces sp. NBC_00103]MCX5367829.1 hypothetical protein [Streptomyces sp. NBC_00103]